MKYISSQLLIVLIFCLLFFTETNGQDVKPTPLNPICVEENYKPKQEADLAAMTLRELVDEEVKAQLLHNELVDYIDLVRKYARKGGIRLLPILTEYINAYAPDKPKPLYEYDPMSPEECNSQRFSVAMYTANDIDRFDFRLRGTKEGQATIEALERAIQKMKEADLDKEENLGKGFFISSSWNLRDQKGINSADRSIQDTFWVFYRIEICNSELLEFSNFLVSRDPTYPSWSDTSFIKDYSRINEWGNPAQVYILNKPEHYYKEYLEFKKKNPPPVQTDQEKALKKRVDLFYKHFTDGEIEKMHDFVLKENKDNLKNEKDKKKSEWAEKFLQQLSRLNPKVCIKNIKIENQRAVVSVEISFWNEEKQEWCGETMNNVWVFEDNDWFFKS